MILLQVPELSILAPTLHCFCYQSYLIPFQSTRPSLDKRNRKGRVEQGREREREVGRRKGGKRRRWLRKRRHEGNTGERDKHCGDLKIRDLLLIL